MNLGFNNRPQLLTALKSYNKERFMTDLMAGLIVGIVALPLAIAFGIASGVSPDQGLITAIIGGFFVAALGGSSVQIGGPTGAFIVILLGILNQYGMDGLLVSTFLAGVILLVMGLLKLGSAIKFIPYPINIGFTSGISITIFTSQMPDFFGIHTSNLPGDFIGKWSAYIAAVDSINPVTVAVGVATVIIILLTPKVLKRIPGSLVALVLMTACVYILGEFFGIDSVQTIGDRFSISNSFPTPKFFDIDLALIQELLPSALTIAVLVSIESLLSASVADGALGEHHDSNMELVAHGIANMAVPFFGGIPVTGAVARTMTNVNNGGRSPISGIINAIVLLMILLFLGPLTSHIPIVCLAGVLVVVSYNMCEWRTFRSMLKGSKSDVFVLVSTFFLTVFFDLTVAIMSGMIMALLLFMRRVADVTQVSVSREQLDLSHDGEVNHNDEVLNIPKGVEVYHIDGPFFFGVASKFDSVMQRLGDKSLVRIIRMRRVPFMDSTGVHNLQSLVKSSQKEDIKIILSGVNESVRRTLRNAGFETLVGTDSICDNIVEALDKANEYLDSKGQ